MITALACLIGLKQTTYDMTGIYTKKGDGLVVNGRPVLSWSTGTGSVYIIQKGTTLTFNGDSKGGHLQFTGVVTGNRFKVTSVDVADDVAWDSSPARRAAVRAIGQRDSIEGEAESEDVIRLTYRSAVFEFDGDRLVAVKPVSYPVILERQYITVNSVKVGSERSVEELRKISDLAQAQMDTINGLAKQIGVINDQIDRLGIEQEETRDALRAIEPGRVAATRKLNAQKLQSSYLDSLIRLKEATASGSASSADLDELRRLVAIYEDTCSERKCTVPPAWRGATLAGLRSELAKQNAAEAAIRTEFRSVMDQGYALNRKLKNAQRATQDLLIKRSRLRNEVAVQTATLKALMANPDAAVWPGDCFPKKLQFLANGKINAEAQFGNPRDLLEHIDRLTEEAKVSRESLRQSADALREAYKFAVNEEQKAFGSIAAAQVKSLLAQFGVEAGDFALQIGKEGPAKAALGKLKDIAKEAQVKLFEYANRDPKKGPKGKLDIVTSMWDYDVYDQGELRKKLEESEKIPERALAEGQDMAGELIKQHVVDSESYLLFFKGRGERIGRWLAGRVPDSRWTKKDRMPAGMDYNLVLLLQGPPPGAVDFVEKDFGALKLLGQTANRVEFLHEGYQFERKSNLELSLRR
jgi:hypothetical protein